MSDPPVSCFIGIILVITAIGNYVLRAIILPRSFVFNKVIVQQ